VAGGCGDDDDDDKEVAALCAMFSDTQNMVDPQARITRREETMSAMVRFDTTRLLLLAETAAEDDLLLLPLPVRIRHRVGRRRRRSHRRSSSRSASLCCLLWMMSRLVSRLGKEMVIPVRGVLPSMMPVYGMCFSVNEIPN